MEIKPLNVLKDDIEAKIMSSKKYKKFLQEIREHTPDL